MRTEANNKCARSDQKGSAMIDFDNGTIRASEVRKVIEDFLRTNDVSPNVWSIKAGKLRIPVGEHVFEMPAGQGATFYGLRNALARLETVINEMRIARDRRQLDIETAIRGSTT